MWNMDETKETDKAIEGQACEKYEFLSYDNSNEILLEWKSESMVIFGWERTGKDAAGDKSGGCSLYIVKVNLGRRARSGEKNYFTGDQP